MVKYADDPGPICGLCAHNGEAYTIKGKCWVDCTYYDFPQRPRKNHCKRRILDEDDPPW